MDANAKFILHSNGNSISAEEAKALSQGDGYYQSQCSDFVLMMTVTGNGKTVSFQVSDEVHLEKPVEVQTYHIRERDKYIVGDYQMYVSAQELDQMTNYEVFSLNDDYYVALSTGTGDSALYKITQFEKVTENVNGEICGQPANLKTVEVGKAEKLCTFSGEKLLKAGAVDGSIYMQSYKDGKVLTRLMDSNGASQSSKSADVSTHVTGNVYLTISTSSTSDAQSFCTAISLSENSYGTYLLTGFNVKDGKLSSGSTAIYSLDGQAISPIYLTLSKNGNSLLFATTNFLSYDLLDTPQFEHHQNGLNLMAFENESDTPYYEGWLNFNQLDDLQPADLGYVSNGIRGGRGYAIGEASPNGYIYYQF